LILEFKIKIQYKDYRMNIVYAIALGILAVGAVIGIYSLISMKLPVEKMVALDVISTLVGAVLLILSVVFNSAFILDITIVYAILSFGAVLVVARFKERGI
jgi:multicomponent Na+:H+ antiporter subunit F